MPTLPTVEMLLRYNRPGPRYTSYPTVPSWQGHFPQAEWERGLAGLQAGASVYVHVPFCKEQCTFCACNMVVAGRLDAGDRYLAALERQLRGLPIREGLPLHRVHLGGGSPTWLSPEQLVRLFGLLRERFSIAAGAEISVEADPDTCTDDKLDTLVGLGMNRLSFGVQSFDPAVLEAVNRPQSAERIAALCARGRALGVRELNLDLMLGLPRQDIASLTDTVERALALEPGRLAAFSYAHVPRLKPHQRRLEAYGLPGPAERAALALALHGLLSEAGYQSIGFDHFARRDDELAVAARERRLHRNFMGYTTRPDLALIGLGVSAISELEGCYAQQIGNLGPWWKSVEAGEPVIERGCLLSRDDRMIREIIMGLMCNLELQFSAIEGRYDIDMRARFAAELAALAALEEEGLVVLGPDGVTVTELGRLLVRNVAMVFDPAANVPGRFSATV